MTEVVVPCFVNHIQITQLQTVSSVTALKDSMDLLTPRSPSITVLITKGSLEPWGGLPSDASTLK